VLVRKQRHVTDHLLAAAQVKVIRSTSQMVLYEACDFSGKSALRRTVGRGFS
jgi:hypothetical protein